MSLLHSETLDRKQRLIRLAQAKADLRKREERALYEGSLSAFVRAAWPAIDNAQYQDSWALDALCEHLEAVTRGHIKRLLINFPPRCGKSLITSIAWPAWVWAQPENSFVSGPSVGFLCGSYNHTLSLKFSNSSRRLLLSPFYRHYWGDRFRLMGDQNAKSQFDTDKGGTRIATSVGGSLIGIGGNIICVDDPHNTESVESDAERDTALRWWKEISSTRLNDPKQSAIVVVMQRLHQSDVTGVICDGDDSADWTHLCCDDHTEILTRDGWVLFPKLQPGVEVMGVNPLTLESRWEMPTSYVRRRFKGQMRHYSSLSADFMVTPDHRVIHCRDRDMRGGVAKQWRVAAAKALWDDFYVPQALKWVGECPEKITFGNRIWEPLAFAEFMGWYLSEGCANADSRTARIVQNKAGRHVADIDRVMSCVPFHVGRYSHQQGKMWVWTIKDRFLARELALLGKSSNKRVPDVLKDLPPDLLEAFILAYAKGDGCGAGRNRRGIDIATASKQMADDLQECAIKCGWATNLKDYPNCGFGGGKNLRGRETRIHRIYIKASKAAGAKRKIGAKLRKVNTSLVDYDGEVYCVSVPSTGIVVRRNGHVTVTGNCLPMRHVESRHCITVLKRDDIGEPEITWEDPRTGTELMWPERFGEKEVRALESKLGPYMASGRLQQLPEPDKGGIIPREAWQLWDDKDFPHCIYKWASADTAYTEKESNDPTGVTCWGLFQDRGDMKIILMDAWRKRLEMHVKNKWTEDARPTKERSERVAVWHRAAWAQYRLNKKNGITSPEPLIASDREPWLSYIDRGENDANRWPNETYEMWTYRTQDQWGLCEWLAHTCRKFNVSTLLIEAKASGLSAAQEIKRLHGAEGWNTLVRTPEGDKTSRAYAVQGLFSSGLVYAPDREWAEMMIEEAAVFPKGTYRDLTDSMTQALSYVRDAGIFLRPEEHRLAEEIMAKHKPSSRPLYEV